MGSLVLSPNALTDDLSGRTVQWPRSTQELAPYFFHHVTISSDFTLRHLFSVLDRADAQFMSLVLGEDVEPLLEEARVPVQPVLQPSIEYVRVYNCYERGAIYRGFDGWGEWDEPYAGAWSQHPEWPRVGPISVSLTPVGQLLHLPMRYDDRLSFSTPQGDVEYETRISITLVELLKAVFADLAFYGRPEERDEVRRDLILRVEAIDRGEERLIPAEEVFRELRTRFGKGS